MTDLQRDLQRSWEQRPAVVYGLGFWNQKSMQGMLAHLPGEVIFSRSFDKALKRAQRDGASLFCWTTRLSEDQRRQADEADVPIVNVEDGFIRSVGLGAALVPASSLILDGRGIYYDPSQPSDLEWMLETWELTDEERARGARMRTLAVEYKVSKYNLGSREVVDHFPSEREKILVPGQVSDDAAILKTRSDSLPLSSGENPNLLLLKRVRQDNPDAYIVYKPHPDVTSGLRNGTIAEREVLALADRQETAADIIGLIEQCDVVETISSLSGFEALLRGKQVVVHGQPFYAGWGVTKDHTSFVRRTKRRQLDDLVYLTLVQYPSYVSPIDFRSCQGEDVIFALSELRLTNRKKIIGYINFWIAKMAALLGW
ncbi:beta-3-deoxy-D-manno-oct-2-ulosonic acid transferase [uncultured Cohaesibacter sp.]|uniref:capsular polysaccharide export protein, LipB/KpsS family n=1 Tax=uncultured Cohaesibacter sp. TaxID=1002546 RepID=UPI0029C85297|nr:beta-3-deoxy-D-manno-oct-2-ulosonic acid transferase [uncultured Cohaesibacter sp.]